MLPFPMRLLSAGLCGDPLGPTGGNGEARTGWPSGQSSGWAPSASSTTAGKRALWAVADSACPRTGRLVVPAGGGGAGGRAVLGCLTARPRASPLRREGGRQQLMRGKPSPEPTSFWPGGSPAQTLPHPPGPALGLGTVPVRPQAPMPQGSAQGSAPSPATWARPASSSSQTPSSGTCSPFIQPKDRGCVLASSSLPLSPLQNLAWLGAVLLFRLLFYFYLWHFGAPAVPGLS